MAWPRKHVETNVGWQDVPPKKPKYPEVEMTHDEFVQFVKNGGKYRSVTKSGGVHIVVDPR